MGPISLSVCHWQAFPTLCNVMHWLIGLIHKLLKIVSAMNTTPDSFIGLALRKCNKNVLGWDALGFGAKLTHLAGAVA